MPKNPTAGKPSLLWADRCQNSALAPLCQVVRQHRNLERQKRLQCREWSVSRLRPRLLSPHQWTDALHPVPVNQDESENAEMAALDYSDLLETRAAASLAARLQRPAGVRQSNSMDVLPYASHQQ